MDQGVLMKPAFDTVPIASVRDYWDRRPCNLRHSPAPAGTREYFDQVEQRKYFVEPHIPAFAEFGRWNGRRVLEIGCGLGTDTINFARAGAAVTAVDLSSRSLELAQARARIFGVADRITFVEADAERLSAYVAPEAYDLVYSFDVVHHSPQPARILAEIRRHFVGPDSVLKLMVYHRRSWKVLAVLLTEAHGAWWRLEDAVARNSEAQTGCPVTYTYTRRTAAALLAGAGFSTVDAQVAHIFQYRVADYVQYRYVKAPPFNVLPAALVRALERRLGWHLCLTAAPARSGS